MNAADATPADGAEVTHAAPDPILTLLRDATLGDYDVYGELGRGGMAAVYLALDLALNRKVAIKTMLPNAMAHDEMVARFRREAQTAAALSHPHIIQIHSVKQTSHLVYFVMKYIEGRSLESVMREKTQLDVGMTCVILKQVGGALAFAHRKGIVHRDVKPANVMLDEDGWAIVTDFGIAKVHDAHHLTGSGAAIGTPHYMSPEQFNDEPVTGASDQYALGVMAYEMLSGLKPFDASSLGAIITKHLVDPPPDIRLVRPDVPAEIAGAITRMLAKEPASRFPDVDAAIAALGQRAPSDGEAVRTELISLARSGSHERLRMSVPLSPMPTGRSGTVPTTATLQVAPTRSRWSRPQWWMASGAVIMIAAAVLAVAVFRQRPPRSDNAAPVTGQAPLNSVVTASNPTTIVPTPPRPTPSARIAAAAPPGTVQISSFTPGAALYIGGVMKQKLNGFVAVRVAPGTVQLSVRAPGCRNWDSTLTVVSGEPVRAGRRNLTCSP